MKIKSIALSKFRGVEKCSLEIHKVNALIGENNAGKSSLLRALNAFFNFEDEYAAFLASRHQYSSRANPAVIITFDDLPNIRDIQEKAINDLLIIEMKYSPASKKASYKYKKDKYYPLERDFVEKILKKYIDFVLIPPIRNSEEFIISEHKILKKLIEAYLTKHFSNRDTVTPKFKEAMRFFERNALIKIAKELNEIYGIEHNFDFSLEFNENITYKNFLAFIKLFINENDNIFEIDDNGTGIQSLTIIALYRLLGKLLDKHIILAIEEPETNLHPQAQKQLISSLMQSIKDSQDEIQFFITSHSTVIIDSIKHTDILLFRKVPDGRRGFKTTISQLPSDFMQKYELEDLGYEKFHKYRNSDFFFSRFIILVESSTDAQILYKLMEMKGIDINNYNISILNLDGVENFKYPFFLVKELDMPYLVILDKDYFFPYLNGDLDSSRDGRGFPKYRKRFNSGRYIEKLIPNQEDRTLLLELMFRNHSKALDLLEKYNIISMKYCLEMDLVASDTACTLFYQKLNIQEDSRSQRTLLIEYKNKIKKLKVLLYVLNNLPHRNLPNSYKRIKKLVGKKIKEYC